MIWVEGPSDRLYIRRWIELRDRDLIEGVHFSIMFYGGSLLAHLSPDDPSVEDFISLPRINRNFAVVIDSDRETKGAGINETKQRVVNEIADLDNGLAWVTAGYTVENYVPSELLRHAVATVHEGATCDWAGEPLVNPLHDDRIRGRKSRVDKNAIARHAADGWTPEHAWPLDLAQRVDELIKLIRRANDLDEG